MDTSKLDADVRATLARARQRAGLTQRALSAQLEKAHSFIGKVEGGERRVTVSDFVVIAYAVGADPRRLLDGVLGVDRAPDDGHSTT